MKPFKFVDMKTMKPILCALLAVLSVACTEPAPVAKEQSAEDAAAWAKLNPDYKPGGKPAAAATQDDAIEAVHVVVTRSMKSPAGVEFPLGEDRVIDHGGNRFTVRGSVDAPNAMGVQVRSEYLYTLRYRGEGETVDPASWEFETKQLVAR